MYLITCLYCYSFSTVEYSIHISSYTIAYENTAEQSSSQCFTASPYFYDKNHIDQSTDCLLKFYVLHFCSFLHYYVSGLAEILKGEDDESVNYFTGEFYFPSLQQYILIPLRRGVLPHQSNLYYLNSYL